MNTNDRMAFDWIVADRFRRVAAMVVLLLLLPALEQRSSSFAATAPIGSPCCQDPSDGDEDDEIRFQTVSRLTISFAEDDTPISRFKSTLFSSFSDLLTEDELKELLLTSANRKSHYRPWKTCFGLC